jgi:hypothetical protein
MPKFGEDWIALLRTRIVDVGSLADLFRKVGTEIESPKVIRQAQLLDRYSQGLEQLIKLSVKMGDLGEQLRVRAQRQDPRKDPESAPVIKDLQKTCTEAERLAHKVFGMSVDWTLEEDIGSGTGLSEFLNKRRQQDDRELEELFGGDLNELVDDFLEEITRRRYDFRPLQSRPSLLRRRL